MQIRALNPADLEAFYQIRLLALHESPAAFSSDYSENLRRPLDTFAERIRNEADRFVMGAFEAGKLAGVAGFLREPGAKVQHKGYIWGVYVRPAARGRGIAGQLLQALLQRATRVVGLEQIHLGVTVGNRAAGRLYRAAGFRPYGVEPNALKIDGQYYAEELMVLKLAGDSDGQRSSG